MGYLIHGGVESRCFDDHPPDALSHGGEEHAQAEPIQQHAGAARLIGVAVHFNSVDSFAFRASPQSSCMLPGVSFPPLASGTT